MSKRKARNPRSAGSYDQHRRLRGATSRDPHPALPANQVLGATPGWPPDNPLEPHVTVYMMVALIAEADPDMRAQLGDVDDDLRTAVAAYEVEAVASACVIASIAARMSAAEGQRPPDVSADSAAAWTRNTVRTRTLDKVGRVAVELSMGIDADASDLYRPDEEPLEVVRAAMVLIRRYLSAQTAATQQPVPVLLAQLSNHAMALRR